VLLSQLGTKGIKFQSLENLVFVCLILIQESIYVFGLKPILGVPVQVPHLRLISMSLVLCGLGSPALVQKHFGLAHFLPEMLASALNTRTHPIPFSPACVSPAT